MLSQQIINTTNQSENRQVRNQTITTPDNTKQKNLQKVTTRFDNVSTLCYNKNIKKQRPHSSAG